MPWAPTYRGRKVGTFGDLATTSFYPAHHITMGEGGSVLMEKPLLRTLVESFRDWGRDCWCAPGKDNTCGKRFDWQLGELPCGYDHKYTYSHIGYNLKLTDMQAAVGVAQLEKLEGFIAHAARQLRPAARRPARSGRVLRAARGHRRAPTRAGSASRSRCAPDAPFTRNHVIQELEQRKIATRLLFGGNLVRQPAYQNVAHRIAAPLANTDFVMNQVFWIGVYPGLTPAMLDYVLEIFHTIPRCAPRPRSEMRRIVMLTENPLARDLDHVLSHTEDLWAAMRGERIFLTGGTGFVGTWLTESLLWANRRLSLGLSAVLLTRDPEAFRRRSPHLADDPAVTLWPGDGPAVRHPPRNSFR